MALSDNSHSFSVVIPVYGCVECLDELCRRITATLDTLTSRYEIILVNDRSPDCAWEKITVLQQQYPQVKGIQLSRNFGQHIAISAGLSEAKGDYAVVMDCDLQDPPEKIADLYNKIKEGYDLVLARRVERNHSLFRIVTAKAYFWMMSRLTEENVDGSYGSYSMLSRKVIDGFLQFGERDRHYLFIIRWLGFKNASIDYTHEARTIGQSSYSFGRLLQHAVDGLFFQSTVFLRWIVTLGMIFALLGVGLATYFIYQYYINVPVAGWTSLAVLLLICTGVIISSLGVIGLYIGKIFSQTKGRPLYLVDCILESDTQW